MFFECVYFPSAVVWALGNRDWCRSSQRSRIAMAETKLALLVKMTTLARARSIGLTWWRSQPKLRPPTQGGSEYWPHSWTAAWLALAPCRSLHGNRLSHETKTNHQETQCDSRIRAAAAETWPWPWWLCISVRSEWGVASQVLTRSMLREIARIGCEPMFFK
jgi:hypothetical protein